MIDRYWLIILKNNDIRIPGLTLLYLYFFTIPKMYALGLRMCCKFFRFLITYFSVQRGFGRIAAKIQKTTCYLIETCVLYSCPTYHLILMWVFSILILAINIILPRTSTALWTQAAAAIPRFWPQQTAVASVQQVQPRPLIPSSRLMIPKTLSVK